MINHIDEKTFCNFALIEPNLYNKQDSILSPIRNFGRNSLDFDNHAFEKFCENHVESMPNDKVVTPSVFGGSFMCGFIKSLLDIGGFDESITPYFNEDSDLIVRMILKNYKFIYIANSLVYHMGSLTSRKNNIESSLASIVTNNKFLKKWRIPFDLIKENTFQKHIPLVKLNVKIKTKNIKDYKIVNYINNISDNMNNNINNYSNVIINSDFNSKDMAYINVLPYIVYMNRDKSTITLENLIININPQSFSSYQLVANI